MRLILQRTIMALHPSGKELVRLVRAETDPSRYSSFEPITAGPVAAVTGLAIVLLLGVVVAPFRIVRSLRFL